MGVGDRADRVVAPDAGSAGPASGSGEQVLRRVVVVDDHELLRSGTRRILEEGSGFSVVGEAGDGEQALEVVADTTPDVVLVDIRLPTLNGIELARRIVERWPQISVIILTAYDDEHYVRAALAVGVAGYLLKTTPSPRLLESIRAACDGFGVVDRSPASAPWEPVGAPAGTPAGTPRLTQREEEVVILVTRGLANKAIARRLDISPRTVEGHLNHVFDKFGVRSRTELIHVALSTRMIGPVPSGAGDPVT